MRAKEILFVLLKHGMREWLSRSKYGRRFFSPRKGSQRQVHTTQERLRITIEELGPTYIKFGQILADRPDMVAERFRNELKKLQSKAIPLDDEIALNLIEKELGYPIDEVFSSFDRQCLASASIGQVYKGVLKSGEEVIVKIQRPHIENKIKLDLYLMRHLARKAVTSYPELAAINIVGLIDEFGQNILKELDYYIETSNIHRFSELFKDDPRIHVPKVYMDYTTKRLLIMEYISGISPDNIPEMEANGYDLKIIARNGADIVLKMILQHGFFHADPHPGNIFIMPGNVLAFIDFGMTGVLKPRDMNFLANFALGFARMDSKSITDALLKLCGIRFYDRIDELQFEIDDLLKRNSYLPFEKMDFAKIMQDCVNIIVKYELQIPSSIFLLLKALATIEKFAGKLDPDIALGPVILPYAKSLVAKKYDPRRLASDIYDTITDYISLIRDFPGDVNEILYKIKEGKMQHEINVKESQALLKSLKQFSQRIALVVLLTGMILCSVMLVVWGSDKTFGKVAFGISFFFSIWIVFKLLVKTRV
ncbi:MAG: AarF/ABC1/UbiB kinase family protein [Bacteroidota bacterium]|nr:AarF/ABC1/UbiB kinase family protein [Bacteroidota bacterium]